MAKNEAYKNALKIGNKAAAKIKIDTALINAIVQKMNTGLELFKEFQDNPSFKKWLQESVFNKTYDNRQTTERI